MEHGNAAAVGDLRVSATDSTAMCRGQVGALRSAGVVGGWSVPSAVQRPSKLCSIPEPAPWTRPAASSSMRGHRPMPNLRPVLLEAGGLRGPAVCQPAGASGPVGCTLARTLPSLCAHSASRPRAHLVIPPHVFFCKNSACSAHPIASHRTLHHTSSATALRSVVGCCSAALRANPTCTLDNKP